MTWQAACSLKPLHRGHLCPVLETQAQMLHRAAGSTRTLGCAPCSELFMFTPPTMQDKDSQVLWWVLQGCDPDGYRPSPAEAAGKGAAASWVKNRNVILRWEALETALRQVSRLD